MVMFSPTINARKRCCSRGWFDGIPCNELTATLKNFYVQISRDILGMTLVTDNKEALAKAIENNPDEKESLSDMISSKRLIEHNLQFQDKYRLSIQPVINIKTERESYDQQFIFF